MNLHLSPQAKQQFACRNFINVTAKAIIIFAALFASFSTNAKTFHHRKHHHSLRRAHISHTIKPVQQGIASWYGPGFHHHRTALHERFNMYAMTAASPNLPLASYARVTNLRNGKQVIVKINDRGPFAYQRILDVSYAAAKKLGFIQRGTTLVKVELLKPEVLNT